MATSGDDPLVPDENIFEDQDSSLGDNAASSTQSISSSILKYRQENGRTYHAYKDGKYSLPNDEQENERLDLQHTLLLRTFHDKLGFAPPNDPDADVDRVLDVGTGTGIWALDYADEHPRAEVIGVDLSPTQPSFVPPNVQFLVDDIDEEWTYSIPFDYIHSRMMNSSIGSWENYTKKIFDNLKPGGYVELQEIGVYVKSDDGTLTKDHNLFKWTELLYDASKKQDRVFFDSDKLKDVLTDAGFVDVTEARFKWPSNSWPKDERHKELGLWNNENFQSLLAAATLAPFTRTLGWSSEEITVFLANVRKELHDPKIHAYWPIVSVYGRKPLDRE